MKIKVRFITTGDNDDFYVQANNTSLDEKSVLKLATTGCVSAKCYSRYSVFKQTLRKDEMIKLDRLNLFLGFKLGILI